MQYSNSDIITEASKPPQRGRPRSVEADDAILAATLDLLSEVGIHRMSMDVLAAQAGVSKTTIYRRWPSKEALVLHALSTSIRPFDDVNTGSLQEDLDLYLGELVQRFKPGPANDILPHLIETATLDSSVRSALDEFVKIRRFPLRTILERAKDRGELDNSADTHLLIDSIIGSITYRRLLTREPVDTEFMERLLALVLPSLKRGS